MGCYELVDDLATIVEILEMRNALYKCPDAAEWILLYRIGGMAVFDENLRKID